MQYSSVLKPYFRDVEAAGGYGSCHISFPRGDLNQQSLKETIKGFSVSVEVLVPFRYHGEDLVAIGRGKHRNRNTYLINELSDLEYHIQRGRMAALKGAVADLEADIRAQMLKTRETTSPRKQTKKIRSIFRRVNFDGLVS